MKRRGFAIAAVLTSTVTLIVLLSLLRRASPDISPSARAAPQDTPTVTGVDPASAPNDLDTPVVITGTGFVAGLSPVGSTVIVITQPVVKLGDTILPDAGWVSSATLTATVPWGLIPGVYTLTVVNPDGQSGSLPNAFTVTQGIGVWTTGGPYGGPVHQVVINPVIPTTLYANAGFGLFRSRDRGENWQLVKGDVNYNPAVSIDPTSPNTLYLGQVSYSPVHVLSRSDDGGDSWVAIPITAASGNSFRPFAHPLVSGTVYVAVDCGHPWCGGLWKSSDRGQTWITKTTELTDTGITALAFDPLDPAILYVGTSSGNVFHSTNGGDTWEFIGQPDLRITQLGVDPFGAREVWACAGGVGQMGYLWRHEGASWTQMFPGTGANRAVAVFAFDQNISGTIWIGQLAGGGSKTTDGGSTWVPFGARSGEGVLALAVDSTDSHIVYQGYFGTGIYKTIDDGTTWREVNHGLAGVVPAQLAVAPSMVNSVYAIAGQVGAFKSDNGGGSWRRLPEEYPTVSFVAVDPYSPTRVYVSLWEGATGNGVTISADGGSTWHEVHVEPPPQYQVCCELAAKELIAPPGLPGHLVMGVEFPGPGGVLNSGGIYTSEDFGETWTFVDMGREISPVAALAYDPLSPTVIYAGLSGNWAEGGAGWAEVLKSTDGGNTWQSSRAGLESWSGIGAILVEPGPPHRVFVTGGGLFVSTDGGSSWLPANMPPGNAEALAFAPGEPPILYAGSNTGLYRSTDGAQSWQQAAGTLRRVWIHSLTVATTTDRIVLYVVTSGGMVSGGAGQMQNNMTGETLVNAGVYRYTTRLLNQRVYLPLVVK